MEEAHFEMMNGFFGIVLDPAASVPQVAECGRHKRAVRLPMPVGIEFISPISSADVNVFFTEMCTAPTILLSDMLHFTEVALSTMEREGENKLHTGRDPDTLRRTLGSSTSDELYI